MKHLIVCVLLIPAVIIQGDGSPEVTVVTDNNSNVSEETDGTPNLVRGQVERALEDILSTRSVDSLINSHVMGELEKLKHDHHELMKQFRLQGERSDEAERENDSIKRELAKITNNLAEIQNISDFQVLEISRLSLEMNETRRMRRLEPEPEVDSGMAAVGNTSMPGLSNSTLMSSVSSTSDPQQYSRVLLLSANPESGPKQMSLADGDVQAFSMNITNVAFFAAVFDPTSRKIIFSMGDRNREPSICSTDLQGTAVDVIKPGVMTYGLAMDTTIDAIFLTTAEFMRATISRMRPDGSDFRVVAEMEKYPYTIAVVPERQLIYTSHGYVVIETSYDGAAKRTILTGINMYALDYDNLSHKLYFNSGNMIMVWSSENNESLPVYELPSVAFNLKLRGNAIYVGYNSYTELGVVYKDKEHKEHGTYTSLVNYDETLMTLCLIP